MNYCQDRGGRQLAIVDGNQGPTPQTLCGHSGIFATTSRRGRNDPTADWSRVGRAPSVGAQLRNRHAPSRYSRILRLVPCVQYPSRERDSSPQYVTPKHVHGLQKKPRLSCVFLMVALGASPAPTPAGVPPRGVIVRRNSQNLTAPKIVNRSVATIIHKLMVL